MRRLKIKFFFMNFHRIFCYRLLKTLAGHDVSEWDEGTYDLQRMNFSPYLPEEMVKQNVSSSVSRY
jgi:hypothetical protein